MMKVESVYVKKGFVYTCALKNFRAVQRLAFSSGRLNDTDTIDRESFQVPPSAKIGQTEHVGCNAVFGGIVASLHNPRTQNFDVGKA